MAITTFTVGQLADRAEVNLATVRYYERRGLIPEPPRRPSGYRSYAEEDVRRIRFIKRAQDLGFSLREIQELLDLRVEPNPTCADIRPQVEAKLTQIAAKIKALQQMQAHLTQLLHTCDGSSLTDPCSILEAIEVAQAEDCTCADKPIGWEIKRGDPDDTTRWAT
jgi:Hg(II)-responsive transcriptional regulator